MKNDTGINIDGLSSYLEYLIKKNNPFQEVMRFLIGHSNSWEYLKGNIMNLFYVMV